jgi:hypothetical protein
MTGLAAKEYGFDVVAVEQSRYPASSASAYAGVQCPASAGPS